MVAAATVGAHGAGACVDFSLGEGNVFILRLAEDGRELRMREDLGEVDIGSKGSHAEGLKGVNLIKLCH